MFIHETYISNLIDKVNRTVRHRRGFSGASAPNNVQSTVRKSGGRLFLPVACVVPEGYLGYVLISLLTVSVRQPFLFLFYFGFYGVPEQWLVCFSPDVCYGSELKMSSLLSASSVRRKNHWHGVWQLSYLYCFLRKEVKK